MKRSLGLWFALICVFNAYAQATQYDPKTLPEGLYLTRWWDIGDSPLGPSHRKDVAKFTNTGVDTYEVVWTRANISVIGFYSSGIGSFSGGYYTEGEDGREEDDFGWGGFLLHWNGVTLSGRWIPFGDSLTGYIIFYPLGSTYTVETALSLLSHDNGK